MSGLNSSAIIQAGIDHLLATGLFDSGVQGHEAISAPGNGLSADLWADGVRPAPLDSGLAETTAILTLASRIYLNVAGAPLDGLETTILGAVDALLAAYSAAFTFSGLVQQIDLLGAHGVPLSAQGGYVTVGDVFYRCFTITIPCVIDNAWPQAP